METEKTSPHPLSLMKSILLEAPKETSSAMFDAAFELFSSSSSSSSSSSRGREEDEQQQQQQQQQQPMVLLRIARAKEKLEAHFRGKREEEMEAMAFLEYLKTRVVARVVEKKTGAGEEEEEEEEEEETRRMRVEKVVESVLENDKEDEEEENEKARNRLKKILLAKSVAWFEKKKSKTRGDNDGREAVDGGSVDDDTVVERLAATNLVGEESDGRRSLGIKTPRLVEYDWTAYATRASSSALESKASHTSSSSSSSSSSSCFRLSLRVASDGGREDEKENTASREDIQHHDLDLDLDSLAVLVDALRDAKSAVAFGGGKGGG